MSLVHFLAFAPAPQGEGSGGGSMLMSMIPFVAIMVIFYFLIIRPNQQRQKKHQAMLDAVQKGDRVLTNGGLYATVLNVKDDLLVAEIASGVKVEIAKSAVAGVVQKKS
jgi:preprotein translocase subunit YajC